jgi:hypothetical protein
MVRSHQPLVHALASSQDFLIDARQSTYHTVAIMAPNVADPRSKLPHHCLPALAITVLAAQDVASAVIRSCASLHLTWPWLSDTASD